jgi:hypothetical protein
MMNRLLYSSLSLVINSSIAVLAAAALVFAHLGVLRMISGAAPLGGGLLGVSAGLALAATFMIRSRNDLADR